MALSDDLIKVYASAPGGRRYIETLEFSHPLFSQAHFLAADYTVWNFLLEDGSPQQFEAVPFTVKLPDSTTSGNQSLQFAVGNVGRLLADELEAAIMNPRTPIKCVYRVYLDIPNTAPQNDPVLSLSVTSVNVTDQTVSAEATHVDVLNRRFPFEVYTTSMFPGLLR